MGEARRDWEERIGRRREAVAAVALPPPAGVRAESGAGQVTLRWEPVEGAVAYLVHRAPSPEGPWELVDHRGNDLLCVPGPAYADTTGPRGQECWYAVSSLEAADAEPGDRSAAVAATALESGSARVRAQVRADAAGGELARVWRMIGSERLSQLLDPGEIQGHPIAEEFAEALRLARDELGATRVRAHAILHDDVAVYAEHGGKPEYDFSRVFAIYDRVLEIGLHPVVEVSFMPRALAEDPEASVFDYVAQISTPRDWERWGELCGRLAEALVGRYGVEEVARWGFEIWNEPNLEVFWTGSREDYFQLYDVAVEAIKAVDERLLVGGPSTAAGGWTIDFLDHVAEAGTPMDFLTTHAYGVPPLDVRSVLRARGLDEVEIWWTEWGVTPTHFARVNDSAFGAPFVLHGMKAAQGRADALAYWVVSDHFEELGRGEALLHGGFGLLTYGNLRKPRWWALALAEQLGDELLSLELSGDGAGSLVDGWAARGSGNVVDVLLWNGTLDQNRVDGDPLLDRRVEVRVVGLEGLRWRARLARVDLEHSNLAAKRGSSAPWPDAEHFAGLREDDRLFEEELGISTAQGGVLEVEVALPMPGVARLRLEPA